jgi:hypothetical protein
MISRTIIGSSVAEQIFELSEMRNLLSLPIRNREMTPKIIAEKKVEVLFKLT